MPAKAVEPASFLTLPPELRNNIYELLFGYGKCEYFNPVLSFWGLQHCQCLDLALLRVCRQTRKETFQLFYENHDFRFILGHTNKTAIRGWLESIGEEGIAHIRRFHLRDYDRSASVYVHPDFSMCRASTILVELGESGNSVTSGTTCKGCEVDLMPKAKRVATVLHTLPQVGERPILTREKLEEVFTAAGRR